MAQIFSCSVPDFYNACRIGSPKIRSQFPALMAFKQRFEIGQLDAFDAAVDAADLLPDYAARRIFAEIAKLNVIAARQKITNRFSKLVSYIDDCTEADKRQLMYDAAGAGYLNDAKKNKWGSVTSLVSSELGFFDTYSAVLTANKNMPPQFEADARAECLAFKPLYSALTAAESDVNAKKDEKTGINNDLYTTFLDFLTNTRLALEDNDPETAKQFTFANFVSQAKAVKIASLVGKVTLDKEGTLVAKGVVVSLLGTAKAVETDAKGLYDFGSLAVGKYVVSFQKEGLLTQSFEKFAIKSGTTSRLNVVMETNPTAKKE
jgi:Carboxypeptidase regulatory-like domain